MTWFINKGFVLLKKPYVVNPYRTTVYDDCIEFVSPTDRAYVFYKLSDVSWLSWRHLRRKEFSLYIHPDGIKRIRNRKKIREWINTQNKILLSQMLANPINFKCSVDNRDIHIQSTGIEDGHIYFDITVDGHKYEFDIPLFMDANTLQTRIPRNFAKTLRDEIEDGLAEIPEYNTRKYQRIVEKYEQLAYQFKTGNIEKITDIERIFKEIVGKRKFYTTIRNVLDAYENALNADGINSNALTTLMYLYNKITEKIRDRQINTENIKIYREFLKMQGIRVKTVSEAVFQYLMLTDNEFKFHIENYVSLANKFLRDMRDYTKNAVEKHKENKILWDKTYNKRRRVANEIYNKLVNEYRGTVWGAYISELQPKYRIRVYFKEEYSWDSNRHITEYTSEIKPFS